MAALQMLDFIEDTGEPTDALNALRVAPSDEFAGRLAEHLRVAYAPIFAFTDPQQDSPQRVRDAFRGFKPIGQQQRMVSLFLGLCERAEIVDTAAKRSSSSPRSSPRVRTQSKPPAQRRGDKADVPRSLAQGEIPGPLMALLYALPPDNRWTKSERDKWLRVFEVNLDFSIATVEDMASGDE